MSTPPASSTSLSISSILMPRQAAPALNVPTLGHGPYTLNQHLARHHLVGIEEPALFSEPDVFIVRPDGTLCYGAVQTMPFARPRFDELPAALDFALARNHPARGEYAGPV